MLINNSRKLTKINCNFDFKGLKIKKLKKHLSVNKGFPLPFFGRKLFNEYHFHSPLKVRKNWAKSFSFQAPDAKYFKMGSISPGVR